MNEHFRQHIESLHASFEVLLRCPPFIFSAMPSKLPGAGIYLFSEGERHLYVGRTNSLRKRLQQHCRPSSSHNSSPFAFRLARQACNVPKATYTKEGSRAHLLEGPAFLDAFVEAKARVCRMSVRVVGEATPMRQALLEMYVSISLDTIYNDFDNH